MLSLKYLVFSFFITIGLILECHSANEYLSKKLSNELNGFLKNRKEPRLQIKSSKTLKCTGKHSNMRKTSDAGKLIDDITSFVIDFTEKESIEGIKKRETASALKVDTIYCPFNLHGTKCNPRSLYQTYDGTCNNLENPFYGKSNTPYKRFLSPSYDDGFNSPRILAASGKPLPNPRIVSLAVSVPSATQRLEKQITHLFAIFGQFLAHDITGTSTTAGEFLIKKKT